MSEPIRAMIEATPLLTCIAGSGLVALAAQALLLATAVRWRTRQRTLRLRAEAGDHAAVAGAAVPGPWFELLALAALAAVPAATFAAVEHARAPVAAALQNPDVVARFELWRDARVGQLAAMSLGIVAVELAGSMGVIAWSLAFAARRQIAQLVNAAKNAGAEDQAPRLREAARYPRPETETVVACACAVGALAVLPALHGTFSYCSLAIKRLAGARGFDPVARLGQIDTIFIEARRALDSGMSASKLGLLLAAITCAGLLAWKARERAARQVR